MRLADPVSPAPRVEGPDSRGIALVLVLIFTVLFYVLIAELVVTARMQRLTGENDALLARMANHMRYVEAKVEEQLKDDLASGAGSSSEGAAPEEGGAGEGPALPGLPDAGGAGGGEGESNSDSSQDVWYEPTAYADDDLTTYVWVEDENRKFNILSLISPDQDFAQESRDCFIRLIDHMREDSRFDLSVSDGDTLANTITDWLRGQGRTEDLPRPPLKSDPKDQAPEASPPLQLDELLLLRGIDEELFFDRVIEDRLIPGLESVLTIYTSLAFDPGDPNAPGAAPAAGGDAGATPSTSPPAPAPGGTEAPQQPIGVGIKINLNTAPRAVLRCLVPEHDVPDHVIEAILRYRNEVVEEEEEAADDASSVGQDYFGDFDLGTQVKKKIFESVEDLEKLPEFQNLPSPEAKEKFLSRITVQSDVFSVHMASVYKRDEQRRVFVLRRAKSVLVRVGEGGDSALHPLILFEERDGLRVQGVDFPDETTDLDYQLQLDEMDEFAQEERKWNPFFLDFYRKRED